MAILSKHVLTHTQLNFIFIDKDIIVCQEDFSKLPPLSLVEFYLEEDLCKDYYSEDTLNYNSILLDSISTIPEGYTAIPLRQFFWTSKDSDKTENFNLSDTGVLSARAHGFLMLRQDYKYCPTCGSPLTDDLTEAAFKCTGCGKLLFPRIEPAVIVLVTKGNQILLAKNKTRNTFYSCIAGFVEQGESLEQTVIREVKEETNLEITNVRYIASQSWPFPDQLMLGFFADYKEGTIKCQESELEDAQWFDIDNLPVIPKEGSIAFNLISHFIKDHCND